jgi:hypothetical protein
LILRLEVDQWNIHAALMAVLENVSALETAYDLRWYTGDYSMGRHIFSDDAARSNDGLLANGDTAEDRGAGTNRGAAFD